jgi:hypothetical protein
MSTYGVELLYRSAPVIERASLLDALRARLPSIAPLHEDAKDGVLAFMHRDAIVSYEDADAPAQLLVQPMQQAPSGPGIEAALQQSWNWPEARDVVATCNASVIVTDVLASGLPHRQRFHLITSAILSVLDLAPAIAIHWRMSQQMVDPTVLQETAANGDLYAFAVAGVNVRFFNVADAEGEMLMDTVGLSPFFLPDFQCHFRDIDPDDISRLLLNLAAYTYENGDVITDGQTVDGLQPGTEWQLQHEDAMVEPEREVIDIDPGDPYAAGERER